MEAEADETMYALLARASSAPFWSPAVRAGRPPGGTEIYTEVTQDP
jgi:hypothetical protein